MSRADSVAQRIKIRRAVKKTFSDSMGKAARRKVWGSLNMATGVPWNMRCGPSWKSQSFKENHIRSRYVNLLAEAKNFWIDFISDTIKRMSC